MWFSFRKMTLDMLAILKAENADLRAQLRAEREQFIKERQELVDLLVASTNPTAIREVRRNHPPNVIKLPSPAKPTRPRIHFPGIGHNVPPLSPTRLAGFDSEQSRGPEDGQEVHTLSGLGSTPGPATNSGEAS